MSDKEIPTESQSGNEKNERLKSASERLPRQIIEACRRTYGDEENLSEENWKRLKSSVYDPFEEVWMSMAKDFVWTGSWQNAVRKFQLMYAIRTKGVQTTPEAYVIVLPRAVQFVSKKYGCDYFHACRKVDSSIRLELVREYGGDAVRTEVGKDFWEICTERFPATFVRERYLWLKWGVDLFKKYRNKEPEYMADVGCSIGVGIQSSVCAERGDWDNSEIEIRIKNAPDGETEAMKQNVVRALDERAVHKPLSIYKFDRAKHDFLWSACSAFPKYFQKVRSQVLTACGITDLNPLRNAGREWVVQDMAQADASSKYGQQMDMVWVSVMLYLMEPEQRKNVINNVKHMLVPGGLAMIADADGCLDEKAPQKELLGNLFRDRGTKLYGIVGGYCEDGHWRADDPEKYTQVELGTFFAAGGNTSDACCGLEIDWEKVLELEAVLKGTGNLHKHFQEYGSLPKKRRK